MVGYAVTTSLLALLGAVAGHGGGQHYIIDGVIYDGNYDEAYNTVGSIQRNWTWVDNVMTLDDPNMACGSNGLPHEISFHAPINAGSIVTVNYTMDTLKWQGERPWTFGHPIGPMLAYMAACPDEGCEDVDVHAPIWFKIWDAGLVNGTWPRGYWAMRDVFEGAELDIPTPASLKSGKYLFRHEMLNLETGPAQWFPNCIQLEVSGSGSGLPDSSELVAFPGAYDKDVDISFTFKGSDWLWTEHGDDTEYILPGPPVWQG